MNYITTNDLAKEIKCATDNRASVGYGVALITGVAVWLLACGSILGYSLYREDHLPYIKKTITDGLGQTRTIRQIAPGYEGQNTLWILSATLGSILGSPFIGMGSGLTVCCLDYFALHPYRKAEEQLLKTYRSDAPVPPKEIARCAWALGDDSLKQLAPTMSFEQLMGLKTGLGRARFFRYIDDTSTQPAHGQWSWLLKLPSRTDYDAIRSELTTGEFGRACQNPHFLGALHDLSPLSPRWCSWIQPSKEERTITLQIGEIKLIVQEDLLTQNLGYFKSLFQDPFITDRQQTLSLDAIEGAEQMPTLIALLQEEIDLTAETCRNLIPLADALSADRLMASIEAYLIHHSAEFSENECYTLAHYFPKLSKVLQDELIARNIQIGDWEKEALFIQQYKLTDYQHHLINHIARLLVDTTSLPAELTYWLKASKAISPADIYLNHLNLVTLTDDRLPILYQYAIDTKADALKQKCLNYCGEHASRLGTYCPWPFPLPDEINTILFPTEDPLPHQEPW